MMKQKFIFAAKRTAAVLLHIILFLWQLPQNIVGLVLLLWYRPVTKIERRGIAWFFRSSDMKGAVTLGSIIIMSPVSAKRKDIRDHEYGHSRGQSLLLGPFYLLAIGIQSLSHAGTSDKTKCCDKAKDGYDHFWTEGWATKKGAKLKEKDWLVDLLEWLAKP